MPELPGPDDPRVLAVVRDGNMHLPDVRRMLAIADLHAASATDRALGSYLQARGIDMPSGDNRARVIGEAHELLNATDPENLMHETADVVLAAAVVAHQHGFTIEQAITAKTAHDRNRNRT